jgi:Prophage tail length tape measure protein
MADGLGFLGAALSGFGGGSVGGAVVHLLLDSKQFDANLKASEAKLAGTSTSMGSKLKPLVPLFATIGTAAAVGIGIKAVQAFQESENAIAQTAAVLKSTGGQAGVTADQVTNLATKFQNLTTFSDEEVRSAENMLLTFTNISSDIFPQTTEAVLDMSQALGQDLKSSSIQLGKALNDPISGLTSLGRVGVKFTQETKDQIKVLVEHGKTLEAQKIILGELSTEFGGSATAAAKTFGGQIKQLANQFNDVLEALGKFLVSLGKNLLPAVKAVVPILKTAADHADLLLIAFAGFATVKWVLPFLATIAVRLQAVAGASLTAQGALSAWFTNIGRVVPYAAAAIAGVALAQKQLSGEAARSAITMRDNVHWLVENRKGTQSWTDTVKEALDAVPRWNDELGILASGVRQFSYELQNGRISQGQFNLALDAFAQNDDPDKRADQLSTILRVLNEQASKGHLDIRSYKTALEGMGLSSSDVAGQMGNLRSHVTATGKVVRNFANMTSAELKAWRKSVQESIAGASLTIGGVGEKWRHTAKQTLNATKRMARDARIMATDLDKLADIKAPDAFKIWLVDQGPGWIHGYVDATKKGKQDIEGYWAEAAKATRNQKAAFDEITGKAKAFSRTIDGLPTRKVIELQLKLTATGSGATASDQNIADALARELVRAGG